MSDQRKGGISWTDETWNPIRGCRRKNTDCIHCYAERTAATRMSGPGQAYFGLAEMTPSGPRWTGKIDMVEDKLYDPLGWQRPRMVFVNSMSDLFYEYLTFDQIDRIVAVMALSARHRFQVLTKRWDIMATYLESRSDGWGRKALLDAIQLAMDEAPKGWRLEGRPYAWPIENIWWGGSAGHQKAMDEAGPHLLRCRPHAKVLWLSAEPLWNPMSIHRVLPFEGEGSISRIISRGIDWVVVGGESGPEARPLHPAWARTIRDETVRAGAAFHFKQWGEWVPLARDERARDWAMLHSSGTLKDPRDVAAADPAYVRVARVGKKAAGRLLDGRVWDEYPRPA